MACARHKRSLAERVGFEPTVGCPTAEGERFELSGVISSAGFQDRCIKPLCHLSVQQARAQATVKETAL